VRAAPARHRLRVRAGDRHPRFHHRDVVNTLYHRGGVLRADTWAAPAGELSRLGLHARLGAGGEPGARAGHRRRGLRGAGLHLAGAEARIPSRHGAVPARPPLLGARRGRRSENGK
jgi:hypothetical protein